jgi:hypothetical protein
MQEKEWIFSSLKRMEPEKGRETQADGVSLSMKQKGTLNRIVSIALLLAMALSLLPTGGAAEAQHGYLVINNNTTNRVVNFRAKPNTNDNTNFPIARLPEYWVVEVLSHQTGWYKVTANINTAGGTPDYRTGYVMDTFLKQMTAEEENAWRMNPTATYKPGGSSQDATPTPTPTPTATGNTIVPELTYGRVTADEVFFRKTASTSGDYWTKLPAGWMLTVLDVTVKNGITWYKVKGNIPTNLTRTYTGYIHGNFFAIINDAPVTTPSPTPTGASVNSDYALVTLDGVNLRQTPGGTTLTALMANTVINVLSAPAGNTENDWFYVEINGVYGYLPATALRVLTTAELGSYVLPAKPSGAYPPVITGSGYVKLVKDKVNIRKTPAGTVLTPKTADKMPVGTVLAYTEGPVANSGYDWVLVTYKGITGYVRSDCFTYCDKDGNPAATATAQPTVTPTPTPTNGGAASQGYIKLIKGGVNLRSSVWGNVLAQLPRDTVLRYFHIVKTNGTSIETWYDVYYSKQDTFGFILSSMATPCDASGKPVDPGVQPTNEPVTVVGYVATGVSAVWIRKTPNTGAETAGQVKTKGTVLPMIGPPRLTDYTWFPVQTADGTRGYLRGDCVFQLAPGRSICTIPPASWPRLRPVPRYAQARFSSYQQLMGGSLWNPRNAQ